MTAVTSAGSEPRHLILYDGLCGLCNRLVQFVLAMDRRRVFDFASLQSPMGRTTVERSGGNLDDLTTFCVCRDYRTSEARTLTKGRASLFVAGALGWPWKATCVLGVLPTPLLDLAYDLVARNRYRVFGRLEQCAMPDPSHRSRFIDS
jgi:predicted DCC family thiol-disulfide oxidoreductase YuxK